MIVLRLFWTIVFSVVTLCSYGQQLAGEWEGTLSQEGKSETFYYLLQLDQDGDAVSGNSFSRTPDEQHSARFVVTGYWDGAQLILQEIHQTEPETPRWCMKYATLQLGSDNGVPTLEGGWEAKGCTPGKLMLKQRVTVTEELVEREVPFTIEGKWTGHLAQSDRDYGFYFELMLEQAENGESYIVSEGNGGSAHHALNWSMTSSEDEQELHFEESKVVIRTDDKWKWCIKSGTLKVRQEAHKYVLEGEWSGYIEGFTPESGPCASGSIYLEKPILTETFKKQSVAAAKPYEDENKRKVKVGQVIEVKNEQLRIRVWDNGTVDGDFVTLFLNGERILHNYRVNKVKRGILVKLNQNDNFLILHAEDLGDISPNTVAVSIDDGEREQRIILSSNLRESGAILIKKIQF